MLDVCPKHRACVGAAGRTHHPKPPQPLTEESKGSVLHPRESEGLRPAPDRVLRAQTPTFIFQGSSPFTFPQPQQRLGHIKHQGVHSPAHGLLPLLVTLTAATIPYAEQSRSLIAEQITCLKSNLSLGTRKTQCYPQWRTSVLLWKIFK